MLNLLFVGSMFTLLAVVMMTIPTPFDYLSFSSFIRIGIILILLPVLFRWIKKARPRGITLDEIPEDALPPVAAA